MATPMDKAWNDYMVGNRLEMGEDTGVDLSGAARLYRRAALRGLAQAQHALAFLYATGQGVARDDALAAGWFQVAAEQGHVAAQHNLGVMYAEGRGVELDEQAAVRWFYRAALGGSDESRRWLDDHYDHCSGME
ncbi:Secretory immunoglobulin A-binding protein EsiB [wastewater metagenome]|uniref:Secretory immunoglobulin A-binding protein EsiB n=2 Tax=unclassified sequences TaxID=12908 RepID=A0A5B8R9U4_9ZZZZ|nr:MULTISPECIES: tetratricopeptide repeat protein [Arhodomonas]MCS4504314.1 sel1 repeat family protein [Arhodomonas aquaeolei]QEA04803.1 secretory immunoglobulin A-binding protein EsiB [uncultured organism]